jgi:hypothetical protein
MHKQSQNIVKQIPIEVPSCHRLPSVSPISASQVLIAFTHSDMSKPSLVLSVGCSAVAATAGGDTAPIPDERSTE